MESKHRHILVIEDNQAVREGILSLLEYCGYESRGVGRYNSETLQYLKAIKVDLIILDIMLSGMDGRDVAKELKGKPEVSEIPILMISAYPNMKREAMQAGADDFLQKPFGLEELREKIQQILGLSKA